MIGFGQVNCPVFGKIKIVDYGEDYSIKIVNYGGNYDVAYVNNFADKAGEWELVEYGEDYKVKLVEYGEDFTIEIKDYIFQNGSSNTSNPTSDSKWTKKNNNYDISDVITPVQSTAVIPDISKGVGVISTILNESKPWFSCISSKYSIWDKRKKNMDFKYRRELEEGHYRVHFYQINGKVSSYLLIETPQGTDKCYCTQNESVNFFDFNCSYDFVETMTEMWFGKGRKTDFRIIANEENGYVYIYHSPNFWGKFKRLKRLEDVSFTLH
mgnify:CR=1 FL=1|tara:strand:- start:99 stop:902 length:804 start_codon:yes stop_codon:yes gene_type:complete